MARASDVFVIDGDVVLKPRDKQTPQAVAGSQTVPLMEPKIQTEFAAPGATSARPAAAASLSLWIWGAGQWLNRDRDLAVLLFLWEIQIVALHYLIVSTWHPILRMAHIFFVSEWELLLYAGALDFWLIFLLMFNVSQAYRSAERQRGRGRGLGRPWLSGLASLLVPGWGQILNAQLRKGLFFLFAFVVQGYLLAFYLLTPLYRVASDLDPEQGVLRDIITIGKAVLAATAVLWMLSVYDAVLVSRYTRRRAR